MRLVLAFGALLPGPVTADPAMTAEEFEAHVGTDTLTYGYSDGGMGVADYDTDRTLTWQFVGDTRCFKGSWHPVDDLLCFTFEDPSFDACWRFRSASGRLHGAGAGPVQGFRIFEIGRSPLPLSCAPEVGA